MKIKNKKFGNCLNAICSLQKTFFEIYLKRDYEAKQYFYEKKIHQHMQKILYLMKSLRSIYSKKSDGELLLQNMMQLHESVISQGYLRFRVKDFTTFEIIAREIKDLISLEWEPEKFSEKIDSLEEVYHSTLQVVAAEPLAFLMFIQALKDFNEEMMNLKNE